MQFNYRFYQFLFCHAPIDQVVKAMCTFLGKETTCWKGLRSGKYNQKIIDSACYDNAKYHNPPKERMIFFAPNITPGFTASTITGLYTWNNWIGTGDPTFDHLCVQFTTDDKDENAIRSLELMRGNKRYQRFIRVWKDPRWELTVDGEPQPFEDGKSFDKIKGKRIKDYFTLQDLIRFSSNWGCPFDKDEFWASDQLMYGFGDLDDDDNSADWQNENFESWKSLSK